MTVNHSNGDGFPENHYELLFEIVDSGAKLNLYDRRRDDGVLVFLSSGIIVGGSGGNLGSPRCGVNMRNVEVALDNALSNLGGRLGQEFTYDAHAIRTDLGAIGFSYRGRHPKPVRK